jgi:hypothetical protein
LPPVESTRLLDLHGGETQTIARLRLSEAPEIGGDHRRDLGIAARRRVIAAENDRLAVRGYLDSARRDTFPRAASSSPLR